MKRRKETVLALILSVIAVFLTSILLIVVNATKYKATPEFTATVQKTEVAEEGCTIYTEEYGDKLTTSLIGAISDVRDFSILKSGEIIFFRLSFVPEGEEINEQPFLPVIFIRTAEKEIVPLSRYHEYLENYIPK